MAGFHIAVAGKIIGLGKLNALFPALSQKTKRTSPKTRKRTTHSRQTPKISAEIFTPLLKLETIIKANRNTLIVRGGGLVCDGYITKSGKARTTWHNLAKT